MLLRHLIINQLRAKPRIQFTESEARLVGTAIRQFQRCRLLVFGAGNDSSMWNQINAGGSTVFLEHNGDWIGKVREADPSLDIRAVEYRTRITQWRELLDQPDSLAMNLPQEIRATTWDVVLVDAPNGFIIANEYPGFGPIHGRMQSIYASSGLVAPGGFVFVHDAQREVENACCDELFSGACRELFRFRTRKNNGTLTELRCFFASPAGKFSWSACRLQMLVTWLRVGRRPDLQERWQGATPSDHRADS